MSDVSRSLQSWVSTIQIGRIHSWRFSISYKSYGNDSCFSRFSCFSWEKKGKIWKKSCSIRTALTQSYSAESDGTNLDLRTRWPKSSDLDLRLFLMRIRLRASDFGQVTTTFVKFETGFLCEIECGGDARVISTSGICLLVWFSSWVFGLRKLKPTSTTATSGAVPSALLAAKNLAEALHVVSFFN